MAFVEGIKKIFTKVKNIVFLDKAELESIIKELQKTLIASDVDVELVVDISEKIRKKILESDLKNIEKKELLVRLLYDEIVKILGEKKHELKIEKNSKVLLIGLYGSGKTTTTVKLAFYYAKRGLKTAVISLDVHRPAAQDQLLQLAKKANIKAFIDKNKKNPIEIWKEFENYLKKYDVIFIDSAGRDALDKKLAEEIKKISEEIKPTHILLIMPADIGQTAKKQAEFFKKILNIDGVILTRMEGTAKAGGALASCKEVNAKVCFVGVGEKIGDLQIFDPKKYINRILGMGDIEGLIEKMKLKVDEKEKKKIEKRIKEGKFNLLDFYEQIKAMQKMGSLKKIMEFIPGLSNIKIPSGLIEVQEKKLKYWKYAIDSMTPKERENPEIINSSRLARISRGSHVPIGEIKELLKQYKILKEFLGKGLDEKKITRLARRFKFF